MALQDKYINPFTDFGFKKLFGSEPNKDLLIDLQERVFEKLFSVAEIAKFTPEERQGYEQSLKYYRDLKNVIDASYMEGLEEGKIEGKIEGMQERNLEIARQMKADGEPAEKIRRYTGLTEEEISEL